jgi:acyl dehydratase
MPVLKERRWEVMEVGERFGPIDVVATDAMVKAYVYACDDFDPRYLWDAPAAPRVAPPLLLCREARDVIRTVYDIASGGAGMHTKHACRIHDCPRIGELVRISGMHTDKYIKRDKQYIVLESTVTGEDGRMLLVQRSTHIRGLKPGMAKSVRPTAESSPAPTPRPTVVVAPGAPLAVGDGLQLLHKRLDVEQLAVFAGLDWPNIHNSREVARAAGLEGCVASGLQTLGFVSELMARYFGDGWRRGGEAAVAFIAPLLAGRPVVVGGSVVDIEADGPSQRVTVDVWCETADGVRVLAGKASGLLDRM